jgi:glycopeptide antibiotics resistance protein
MEAPKEGLLVRYLFNEKRGSIVTNSGSLIDSLNLNIPEKIQRIKPFLRFSLNPLPSWGSGPFHEILLNVLLFIPLGYLLHATIGNYIDGNLRTIFITMILGGAITLSAEMVQYFIESRDSSSVDVVANFIGTLLGINFKLIYNAFLIRIKKPFWDVYDK